jgi:tripartite-type tricarboxylate transporter receptor subunit TctC
VVPFPRSGSVDVAARALAPPLTKAFGQSVVVENRPGAGTVIGTELVARAPADGHTILIAGFTFIANAALRTKLPFDSMRDFVGVARIGTDPYIISVHPSLPLRTAKDIVSLARANPGQLRVRSTLRIYKSEKCGPGPNYVSTLHCFRRGSTAA